MLYTRPNMSSRGDMTVGFWMMLLLCIIGSSRWCLGSTAEPAPSACKEDEIYRETCYVIRSAVRNFDDAVAGCQEIGGHLVAIEDLAEMDHVKTALTNWHKQTMIWIGASYRNHEGMWIWNYTSKPVIYNNWWHGEPNHYDCAIMYARKSSRRFGFWNNFPCFLWLRFPYMCEVPLPGRVAAQDFNFASYYADNMVLQKAPARAVVWGYASQSVVGYAVTVDIDGSNSVMGEVFQGPFSSLASWNVTLVATNPGGPHNITATLGTSKIRLSNVLFGDVFICSGQKRNIIHRFDTHSGDSHYSNVRTFTPHLSRSDTPLYDLAGITHNWVLPFADVIQSFSAVCWLFGKHLYNHFQYPIGLVQSTCHAIRIDAWSSPKAISQCYTGKVPRSSVLWNSMIHPFLPMTINGAIWYQGESTEGNAGMEGCLLGSIVDDFRTRFNNASAGETNMNFSFGLVQPIPRLFAQGRLYRASECGYTPNSALNKIYTSVASDLLYYTSSHMRYRWVRPRYTRQIAERLVLGVLNVGYNESDAGRYQGPFPTSLQNNGTQVTVTYDSGNVQLEFRGTAGFELCCSTDSSAACPHTGTRWVNTSIIGQGTSTATLSVTCQTGEFVVGLRYHSRESPCPPEACSIYSVENSLPAPPYIHKGLISGFVKV